MEVEADLGMDLEVEVELAVGFQVEVGRVLEVAVERALLQQSVWRACFSKCCLR